MQKYLCLGSSSLLFWWLLLMMRRNQDNIRFSPADRGGGRSFFSGSNKFEQRGRGEQFCCASIISNSNSNSLNSINNSNRFTAISHRRSDLHLLLLSIILQIRPRTFKFLEYYPQQYHRQPCSHPLPNRTTINNTMRIRIHRHRCFTMRHNKCRQKDRLY